MSGHPYKDEFAALRGLPAAIVVGVAEGLLGRTMHGKKEAPPIGAFIIGYQLDQADPGSFARPALRRGPALLLLTPEFPDLRR
jgi:hypothetical protein